MQAAFNKLVRICYKPPFSEKVEALLDESFGICHTRCELSVRMESEHKNPCRFAPKSNRIDEARSSYRIVVLLV